MSQTLFHAKTQEPTRAQMQSERHAGQFSRQTVTGRAGGLLCSRWLALQPLPFLRLLCLLAAIPCLPCHRPHRKSASPFAALRLRTLALKPCRLTKGRHQSIERYREIREIREMRAGETADGRGCHAFPSASIRKSAVKTPLRTASDAGFRAFSGLFTAPHAHL